MSATKNNTAKSTSNHSKNSAKKDDEDEEEGSEIVDKILGLLCYRLYVMFRFICCYPVASKFQPSASKAQSLNEARTTSNNVLVVNASETEAKSPQNRREKVPQDAPNPVKPPEIEPQGLKLEGSRTRSVLKLKEHKCSNNCFHNLKSYTFDPPLYESPERKRFKLPFIPKLMSLMKKEKEVTKQMTSNPRTKEVVVRYQKEPRFCSNSTINSEFFENGGRYRLKKRSVNYYNDIFEDKDL